MLHPDSFIWATNEGTVVIYFSCALESSVRVCCPKCLKSLSKSWPLRYCFVSSSNSVLRYNSRDSASRVPITIVPTFARLLNAASASVPQADKKTSAAVKIFFGSIFPACLRTVITLSRSISCQSWTKAKKQGVTWTRLRTPSLVQTPRSLFRPRKSNASSARPRNAYDASQSAISRSTRPEKFFSRFFARVAFFLVSVSKYRCLPIGFRPAPFRFPPTFAM